MDELETVYSNTCLGQVITMNGSIMKNINNDKQLSLPEKHLEEKALYLKVASQFVWKKKVFDQCILPALI